MTLHNLLFYIANEFFGFNLVIGKLVSLFVSMGTLVFIYKFAEQQIGQRSAKFSVLCILVSPFFITFACQARGYALLMLFSAASSLYFFEYLGSSRNKALAKFFFASLLMVFSHVIGFLLFIVQLIYLLAADRCKRKVISVLFVQAIVFVFYTPVLAKFLFRSDLGWNTLNYYHWVNMPNFFNLLDFFPKIKGNNPHFFFLLIATAVLLFVFFCVADRRVKNLGLYLALWLVFPAAFFFALSHLLFPLFMHRLLISSLIPLTVLTALGLEYLCRINRLGKVFAYLFLISLFAIYWRYHLNDSSALPNWRAIRSDVYRQVDPTKGQKVFFAHELTETIAYFFLPECLVNPSLIDCLRKNGLFGVAANDLAEILSRDRFALIIPFDAKNFRDYEIHYRKMRVRPDFRLVEEKKVASHLWLVGEPVKGSAR